jgi:hypothetical protein
MNEYCKAIYELLTGKGLFMLGAKDMVYCNEENYLSFKIRGCQKFNHIRLQYVAGKDLYTLVLSKYRTVDYLPKAVNQVTHEGLYNDMVRSLITKETGLYLSL